MAQPKTLTLVWGKEGVPCPMERKRRRVDADGNDLTTIREKPVVVPNNRYYRSRVSHGDAKEYVAPAEVEPTRKGKR